VGTPPGFGYLSKWWPPWVCAGLFICLGVPFLGYPGIQQDEAAFAGPILHQGAAFFRIKFFHYQLPLMLVSYYGALKTWIWVPILSFSSSSLAMRLPALLIGAITIFAFFVLLDTIHNRQTAWAGTILLCTDATFLLTTCFDWGPVVLQHFLFVTGILLAVKFDRSGSRKLLMGTFFLFGLAMWDKALFSWMFIGIAIGSLSAFPEKLRRHLNGENIVCAAQAFVIGASPLILYNVLKHFGTYRSNVHFALDEFPLKLHQLRETWNGATLFRYLVNLTDGGQPREPVTALEHFTFWVHSLSGDHFKGANELALVLALLLIPILFIVGGWRVPVFALVNAAVAWFQMCITSGAGVAAHHTILLWPLPTVLIASSFTELSLRFKRVGTLAIALVGLFLASENLLVLNQYHYDFVRNGAAGNWTDAIYPLSNRVGELATTKIMIYDWGILSPLDVLHRGRLRLKSAESLFLRSDDNEELRKAKFALLTDQQTVWIGHTDENEQFRGVNASLSNNAASFGFREDAIGVVCDRNSRPIFQLFRFVPR